MFELPNDEMMLLSVVNMKLRDEFESLDELCAVMGVERECLERKLGGVGMVYDEDKKRFW